MESRKVVSNTGPFIHLNEISSIKILEIFGKILIPPEVKSELQKYKINYKRMKVINLDSKFKDVSLIFADKFFLDLGEAQAIALCLQEKIDYFLTDDLDARIVAKSNGIETHGTVGVILRAFREKMIDKGTTIKKVKELYEKSSLFITRNLVVKIIKEIEEFRS